MKILALCQTLKESVDSPHGSCDSGGEEVSLREHGGKYMIIF